MGNVLMNSMLAIRLNYDISEIIKPVLTLRQFQIQTKKNVSQKYKLRNGMGVLENSFHRRRSSKMAWG